MCYNWHGLPERYLFYELIPSFSYSFKILLRFRLVIPGIILIICWRYWTNDVTYTEDGQKRAREPVRPLGTRLSAAALLFERDGENGENEEKFRRFANYFLKHTKNSKNITRRTDNCYLKNICKTYNIYIYVYKESSCPSRKA